MDVPHWHTKKNDPLENDRKIMEVYSLSFDAIQNLFPLFERIQKLPSLKKDLFFSAHLVLQEQFKVKEVSTRFQELGDYLKEGINHPSTYEKDELREITRVLQNSCETIKFSAGLTKKLELAIEALYEIFDRQLKKNFKESKLQSKEPLVKVSIVGGGFFTLQQEVARAISSISDYGNIFTSEGASHGITDVYKVFYKSGGGSYADKYEIGPEIEYAISALYSILGVEHAIAPTAIIKLSNIIPKKTQEPKQVMLQASYGIEGETLNEILLMIETNKYFERCFGKKRGNKRLIALLCHIDKSTWLKDFFQKHQNLKEIFTRYCTTTTNNKTENPDEIKNKDIEIIYLEFRKICESYGYKKYPLEYDLDENECKNKIKLSFHNNVFNLLGALGLIKIFPEICMYYEDNQFKRVPLCYITDLIKGIKKIKSFYKNLKKIEQWKQIPTEIENLFDKISLKNFSVHFIASVITNPGDHTSQNFIVKIKRDENQLFVKELELIGIDNDHVFVTDGMVRTVLYQFDSLMNKKIDNEIKNNLIHLGAENFILHWLVLLEKQNQRYTRLLNQKIIKENDLLCKDENNNNNIFERIPLKIDQNLIEIMYFKLTKIIHFLKENENENENTHWNILNRVLPDLANANKKTNEIYSFNSNTKFEFLQQNFDAKKKGKSGFNRDVTITEACKAFIEKHETNISSNILEEIQPIFPSCLNFVENKDYSIEEFRELIYQGHKKLIYKILISRLPYKHNTLKTDLLESRDGDGRTTFLIACSECNYDICKILIDAGANINAIDNDNSSCLLLTLNNYKKQPIQVKKIIKLIIDSSKNGNSNFFNLWNKSNDFGRCPLHYIIELSFCDKSCHLLYNEEHNLLLLDKNQLKVIKKTSKCNCDLTLIDLFIKNGCLPLKRTIYTIKIKMKSENPKKEEEEQIKTIFKSPLDIALQNSFHCIVLFLIFCGSTCLKTNLDQYFQEYLYDKPFYRKRIKDLLKFHSLRLQWKFALEGHNNRQLEHDKQQQMNEKLQKCKNIQMNLYGIETGKINIYDDLKIQLLELFPNYNHDSLTIFDDEGNIQSSKVILNNNNNNLYVNNHLNYSMNSNCNLIIKKTEYLSIRYIIDSLYSLLFMNSGLSSDLCFLEIDNKKYPIEIYQELNHYKKLDKSKNDKKNSENQLHFDSKTLSELFLSCLIFSYSNLTPDDFVVYEYGNNKKKKKRLFIINHSSAFEAPINVNGYKNFLFCLDEAKKSLDESVVDHFLSLEIDKLFLIWIDKLIERNEKIKKMNNFSIFSSHKIELPNNIIARIYSNASEIQEILRQSKIFSPVDILRSIDHAASSIFYRKFLFPKLDAFTRFAHPTQVSNLPKPRTKSYSSYYCDDRGNNFVCPTFAKEELLVVIENQCSCFTSYAKTQNQIIFSSDFSKFRVLGVSEQEAIINGKNGYMEPMNFALFDYEKQSKIIKDAKLSKFSNLVLKGVIVPLDEMNTFRIHPFHCLNTLELDNCGLSILNLVNDNRKMPILKKLKLSNIKFHKNKNKNKNLSNHQNSIPSSVSCNDFQPVNSPKELYRSIDIYNSSIEEIVLVKCSLVEIEIPAETKFLTIIDCNNLRKVQISSKISRGSSGLIRTKRTKSFRLVEPLHKTKDSNSSDQIQHMDVGIPTKPEKQTNLPTVTQVTKNQSLKSIILEKLVLQNTNLEPYKKIFQINGRIEIQNIPIPLFTENENIYRVAFAVITQPNATELMPSFIEFYKDFFSFKFSIQKIFHFFYDCLLINENLDLNTYQNTTNKSGSKIARLGARKSSKKATHGCNNNQNQIHSWISSSFENKMNHHSSYYQYFDEIIIDLVKSIKSACEYINKHCIKYFYDQCENSLNLSTISIIWKTFEYNSSKRNKNTDEDDDDDDINDLYSTDNDDSDDLSDKTQRGVLQGCKEKENEKISKYLEQIGCEFQFISELILSNCPITDESLRILLSNFKNSKNQNLKSLDLSQTKITDKSLFYISEKYSNLIELNVSKCDISDFGLEILFIGRYSDLSDDYIRNGDASESSTTLAPNYLGNYKAGCRNLAVLNISYCIRVTDKGLQKLNVCKFLRDINVSHCYNISDRTIQNLIVRKGNQKNKKLKKQKKPKKAVKFLLTSHRTSTKDDQNQNINEDNNNYIDDDQEERKITLVQDELISVDFSNTNITTEGFLLLLSCYNKIVHLNINHSCDIDLEYNYKEFADEFINCLSQINFNSIYFNSIRIHDSFIEHFNTPILHTFDFSNCLTISTKSIIGLIEKSSNLKEIYLSGCPAVNDEVLVCILNCYSNDIARLLSVLHLDDCPGVLNFSYFFQRVNTSGIQFTDLKISNNESINDSILFDIEVFKYLEILNIEKTSISDKGILKLAANCNSLRSFYFDFNKLKPDQIAEIKSGNYKNNIEQQNYFRSISAPRIPTAPKRSRRKSDLLPNLRK